MSALRAELLRRDARPPKFRPQDNTGHSTGGGMTAAVWKRLFVAGGVAAVLSFVATHRYGVRLSAFGVEPEATLFLMFWPVLFGLASVPPVSRAMARWWPDYPAALSPDLEHDGDNPLGPYEKGQSYVGRGALMNRLVGATKDAKPGFHWLQVNGGSGSGKTRLGLEWLRALRVRGWEIGVLRLGVAPELVENAIFRRRPWAILVDDADRDPDLWRKLDALARRQWRHPVLALLTTAQPIRPPDKLPADMLERLTAARDESLGGAVTVGKLNRHDVAVWTAAANFFAHAPRRLRRQPPPTPEALTAGAGGRALFVRLMAAYYGTESPWRALDDMAEHRLAQAAKTLGPYGPALLALAALAGPFPEAEAITILGSAKQPSRSQLTRALPEMRFAPPGIIPAVSPGMLGVEIALRVLSGYDPLARERLGGLAFQLNRAAAAASFAVIAAERPEVLEIFESEATAFFADYVDMAGEAHPAAEAPSDEDILGHAEVAAKTEESAAAATTEELAVAEKAEAAAEEPKGPPAA